MHDFSRDSSRSLQCCPSFWPIPINSKTLMYWVPLRRSPRCIIPFHLPLVSETPLPSSEISAQPSSIPITEFALVAPVLTSPIVFAKLSEEVEDPCIQLDSPQHFSLYLFWQAKTSWQDTSPRGKHYPLRVIPRCIAAANPSQILTGIWPWTKHWNIFYIWPCCESAKFQNRESFSHNCEMAHFFKPSIAKS